jgi:hypothetical protein
LLWTGLRLPVVIIFFVYTSNWQIACQRSK